MASPSPSVEEMLQQLILGLQRIMEKIDKVVGDIANLEQSVTEEQVTEQSVAEEQDARQQ